MDLYDPNGLRWCDVWWGRDANDTTRALVIEVTRARGSK